MTKGEKRNWRGERVIERSRKEGSCKMEKERREEKKRIIKIAF